MSIPVVSGNVLADLIIWVRRIIKAPSTQAITDQTIADYINRFYTYDVPARVQLLDLRRQYTFETVPNIFEYQAPFIPGTRMPQYHMFSSPAYIDGVQLGWYQNNNQFYNLFPELVLNEQPLLGNGSVGPFQILFGQQPVLPGFTDDLGNLEPYVYITSFGLTGNPLYIVDNGQGALIQTDASFQLGPGGSGPPLVAGTVDYITGVANFTYQIDAPADGIPIQSQSSPYSAGFPRCVLYYNNIFKLYPVPDRFYKFQCDCYITPAQFFSYTAQVNNSFAYMSEYLARGAAQKILSDTGDYEQWQFYEPIFRQQENFVLRRADRQRGVVRTPTIYSAQTNESPFYYTQY
jgi:hypothetical protein